MNAPANPAAGIAADARAGGWWRGVATGVAPPERKKPPTCTGRGRGAGQWGASTERRNFTTSQGFVQTLSAAGVRLRSYAPGEHRAPCPHCRRGPRDDALAVRIDSDGGGAWQCFRCGWRGGARGETGGPARLMRRAVPAAAAKTARALQLIAEARPARGTPVETYLAGRGLRLPGDAPLRFHAEVWHHVACQALPAMIAPIVGIAGNEFQGAHVTFLAADGLGKASVRPVRLYVGPKAGGCVKLTPNAEVTLGLAIAEGIETGLAGIAAGYATWACMDAGGLAAFPVLAGIDALTILADHDEVGLAAARQVATRWRSAGRDVCVATPERAGADWADIAKGAVA